MIDTVFRLCVEILMWLAYITGTTYEEINVYIFCVVWPTLTVILIVVVIWQQIKLKKGVKC